jgi:hypothetical protein
MTCGDKIPGSTEAIPVKLLLMQINDGPFAAAVIEESETLRHG